MHTRTHAARCVLPSLMRSPSVVRIPLHGRHTRVARCVHPCCKVLIACVLLEWLTHCFLDVLPVGVPAVKTSPGCHAVCAGRAGETAVQNSALVGAVQDQGACCALLSLGPVSGTVYTPSDSPNPPSSTSQTPREHGWAARNHPPWQGRAQAPAGLPHCQAPHQLCQAARQLHCERAAEAGGGVRRGPAWHGQERPLGQLAFPGKARPQVARGGGSCAGAEAASGAWHLHAKLELHAAAACMLGLRCSGCKP